MVTLRDVAEHAGVSRAVVSAALSGNGGTVRMSEATRERVRQAVEDLGYRTNHAARSLRVARSGIVSAIVPKITNPIFDEALRGIQDAAEENDGVVMISDAYRLTPGSALMSRLVGTGMADGFIVRATQLGDEPIDAFEQRGIPFVVMNHVYGDHVCVWIDDAAGIETATRHLLDLGHRRIAMIGGQDITPSRDPRRKGFTAAFRAYGLRTPHRHVHRVGYDAPEALRCFRELMTSSRPPTGVIVDNVMTAAGVCAGALDMGIRVPDDVSIVAYHDMPGAETLRPAPTCVKMPVFEAGRASYATLQRLIDGEHATSLLITDPPPLLVDRGSTAPPAHP